MCVLTAEQQREVEPEDSPDKLGAIEQAALDARLNEREAEAQNVPLRQQYSAAKKQGFDHKLCRFLLKYMFSTTAAVCIQRH